MDCLINIINLYIDMPKQTSLIAFFKGKTKKKKKKRTLPSVTQGKSVVVLEHVPTPVEVLTRRIKPKRPTYILKKQPRPTECRLSKRQLEQILKDEDARQDVEDEKELYDVTKEYSIVLPNPN